MLRNFRNIIHCIFQSGQIVSYKSFYLLNRTLLCSLDLDRKKNRKKYVCCITPINHCVKESLYNICAIKTLVCHSEAVKENIAVAI